MGKLIAVALAAVALFFVFHSRDAKAAKVTSCLTHAGALVRQSTFLEDHLSTAQGRAENSKLAKKLKDADKNLWDVKLTDDHGLLMRLGRGYTAKERPGPHADEGARQGPPGDALGPRALRGIAPRDRALPRLGSFAVPQKRAPVACQRRHNFGSSGRFASRQSWQRSDPVTERQRSIRSPQARQRKCRSLARRSKRIAMATVSR